MARSPFRAWCFALVVVQKDDQFLVIQERKFGQRWYLPAGGLKPGETFAEAAIRETMEEAGVGIVLEGVLRVEHTCLPDGSVRFRVIFLARPSTSAPPKSHPDDDTLGARWVTLEELEALPLRGEEVRSLFEVVSRGEPVFPLTILGSEGTTGSG